jgi:hypothetical protein
MPSGVVQEFRRRGSPCGGQALSKKQDSQIFWTSRLIEKIPRHHGCRSIAEKCRSYECRVLQGDDEIGYTPFVQSKMSDDAGVLVPGRGLSCQREADTLRRTLAPKRIFC